MQRKLHPSLLLVLDIDEAFDTSEQRLEIDRCYSYLGTPVVRSHARGERCPETGEAVEANGADAEPCNVMRLMVRLGTHHYWKAGEDADALWSDVLASWLHNQFHAIDNQMKIYNRRQREEGTPELVFHWLEVSLDNGACIVRFRLDSTCGIPAAESARLTAVREACITGALGNGVATVILPSPASYAEQRVAGMAAKAERDAAAAQAEAEAQRAKEAEAQAREDAANEMFLESPELAAAADAREEAENDPVVQARIAEEQRKDESAMTAEEIIAQRIAEEENLAEELERKYALPEPDFAIDYAAWSVCYADGTMRDYDSAAQSFIAA